MTIALRLATPADADEIAALFTASRRVLDFLPPLHTPEEDRGFIRDHILPSCRVTVAERDGRTVGFMAESDGWIEHLYVAPDDIASGVGSSLLVEAKAQSSTLRLWCFAENLNARRFYERHGFRNIRETDGSGNESNAPDVEYRWDRSNLEAGP